MDCFQSITQFTNINNIESEKNNYNKNACHFFSLKTAYEFIKNKRSDKEIHESNIYFAMNLNKLYQNKDLFFEEVIQFTDLSKSMIYATTTELVKSGDYPMDIIIPQSSSPYSVVILKNSKYFVVSHHENNFYVRDCHEPFQYNFKERNDLYNHLNKTYQFNESLIVDGYAIPEFSAIEYIIISKPFEYYAITEVNNNNSNYTYMKETDFGLMIEDTNYENTEEVIISKILESSYQEKNDNKYDYDKNNNKYNDKYNKNKDDDDYICYSDNEEYEIKNNIKVKYNLDEEETYKYKKN